VAFSPARHPVVTIPVAILLHFIPLQYTGGDINIMSLAGLAIACGELVDAAIVVVEQTHKKLEIYERSAALFKYDEVILEAVKEVAGPTFFALLVIAVAFCRCSCWKGRKGTIPAVGVTPRTLHAGCGVLALTLDPALRLLLVRRDSVRVGAKRLQGFFSWLLGGKIRPEEKHPITGPLMRFYDPVVRWTLRWKTQVIAGRWRWWFSRFRWFWMVVRNSCRAGPKDLCCTADHHARHLDCGSAKAAAGHGWHPKELFRGGSRSRKTGRADTATDPARFRCLKTVIVLKPHSRWRRAQCWYSSWGSSWTLPCPDITSDHHISEQQLVSEMNEALKITRALELLDDARPRSH